MAVRTESGRIAPGETGRTSAQRAQSELEQAIDAALLERGRRNEFALAVLRAGAFSLSAAVNLAAWTRPEMAQLRSVPIQMPLATVIGAVLSTCFAVLLWRGWYRRWLRWAVPLVDASSAATGIYVARQALGLEVWARGGSFGVMTLLCCVLALSGPFRLSEAAMCSAAAAALAIFLSYGLLTPSLLWPSFGVQLALLLFICGAGFALTRIARRAVRAEVGEITLRRLLPPPVVEAALDDPVSLIEKPRETVASVLFTDVRGFTAWCEGRPASDVLRFLNRLLGDQAEAVRRHGGVVDKFLGDGLLAAFGVLEAHADHADRALEAARDMCAALARLNGELQESGLPSVRVGVGIHTGSLVVGCLGRGARLEFTILGDTVNTASRLPSLSKEDTMTVLLTGDSAAACKRTHEFLPRGEVTVRGRQAPLSVYALTNQSADDGPPVQRGSSTPGC